MAAVDPGTKVKTIASVIPDEWTASATFCVKSMMSPLPVVAIAIPNDLTVMREI